MVVCCWAAPTLLAGGVLGAIGGFLGNPFVIIAGVAVAGAGLAAALVRRPRGGQERARGK
jgi:mercuric ion transport protein